MKLRVLVCLMIFTTITANSSIFSKIIPEISLLKMDLLKQADAVVKMNNDFNTKLDIQNKMTADIKANLEMQNSAVAGLNNKISNTKTTTKTTTSAGRDNTITTSQVNDTSLMKELVNSYRFIIYTLIIQLCALLGMLIKIYADIFKITAKKDEDINRLFAKQNEDLLKFIYDDEMREDKQIK